MAQYVDGFVIVIPKKNLKEYQRQAKIACKVWMEHGALDYRENTGDDLKQPFGKPFPKLTAVKPGEMVIFSWITFKSKASRDKVNAKVMKDPRMDMKNFTMTFDMKKFSYGGFETIVKS